MTEMLDADSLVTLVYVIIGVLIFINVFSIILSLMGRRESLEEKPKSLMERLYKVRKKAAKVNRIRNIKKIICIGDKHHPTLNYARYVGSISDVRMVEVFFKPKFFSKTRWALVIPSLIRHSFGRNWRVKCRGFKPYGMWWIPIIGLENKEKEEIYYHRIDKYITNVLRKELISLLQEQDVVSTIKSANVDPIFMKMLIREDYLKETRMPPSSTVEEEVER